MKKVLSRKTVVAVLAFFLALSAGYAIFSESITIGGTATAKGNFDIGVTCVTGVNTGFTSVDSSYTSDNGFTSDSCSVSGNNVTFLATLNYPGAERHFTIKFTNNGDVTAALKYTDMLNDITYKECVDGKNGSSDDNITDDECETNPSSQILSVETNSEWLFPVDANGNLIDDLKASTSGVTYDGINIIMEPGTSVYFLTSVYMDTATENYPSYFNQESFLVRGEATTNYYFEQYNQ